jgi:choice-of-anchor A domain-containing protein
VVAGKNLNMNGGSAAASFYAGGNAIVKNAGISGALYTGGNANVNNGTIGGGVYYDGKYNGPSYINNHSASYTPPLNFSAAADEFSEYSATLAGMASTGSVTSQWGGITLSGSSETTNDFTMDSSIFTGAWGLTIDAPASSNIVINIAGSSVNMNLTMNTNGISAGNIVLNCYEAKSVNISNSLIFGTVLAADATTEFNGGNLTGSVITDNYVAHNTGMDGPGYTGAGITPTDIAGAIASVPEPATVSGLALMGIAWLGRGGRKRK